MPNTYVEDLVALVNYGSLLFSSTERLSLEFLYNRTVKFNKTSEAVSYDDWKHGIFSSEGKLVTAPSGVDRKTVTKVTRALQERGFITIREKRFGNTKINYFTVHVKKITQELMNMALNLGKKYKEQEEQKGGITKKRVGEKRTSAYGKNGQVPTGKTVIPSKNISQITKLQRSEKTTDTPVSVALESREGLENQLHKARENNRKALQRRIDRMGTDPTISGVSAIWKVALLDHYKGRAVVQDFDKKHYYKFKAGFGKHYLPENISIHRFLEWVIESWDQFPVCEFSWMRSGGFPSTPSFAYFAAMYRHFVKAYADLDEKGYVTRNRLNLAATQSGARKESTGHRQQLEKLMSENRQLKEKEQHLSRLVREGSKPRTRSKKIEMKPVSEIDFASIQPLPAL